MGNDNGIGLSNSDNNRVVNSFITENSSVGISYMDSYSNQTIQCCEIYNNTNYNVALSHTHTEASDVIATNNWWGTTDTDVINEHIWDFYDGNFDSGKVISEPFLNAPIGEISSTYLIKVSGDNQSVIVGTTLLEPLVVQVKNQYDCPMSGVQVDFAVTQGDGSVSPTSALTDADGKAYTELTLGQTAELNEVTATVDGLSVTFSATGIKYGKMLLIPAGEFSMGDHHDAGGSNEKPVHIVYLDAYYIDADEVTNAQYATFLNEYGKNTDAAGHELLDIDSSYCLIEKVGGTYQPKAGYENHPVIMVSWYGAAAYTQFYGKRLPTEAQWEKAARGGLVGQKYPNGDSITHDDANYEGTGGRDIWDGTAPVGSFPPNGYGLYDMDGNVAEKCADEYDDEYYSQSPKDNPLGPGTPVFFVNDDFINITRRRAIRTGSWASGSYDLRCGRRNDLSPSDTDYYVGFRCAQYYIETPVAITLEKVSGENQSGDVSSILPNPFVVRVLDQKSKPLYGVAVNFEVSKGASVKPTQAATDEDGEAQTVLTLGAQPGDYNVTASVKGLDLVVFTATASCEPCEPCQPSPVTNTLVITGTVYQQTKEVAEDGLHVEVNIITQRLTEMDTTGKTAGKGQYSVTFVDMQKPVAKAGDEILITVKDASGKLVGQSRHTLTATEVEAKETRIDVTPFKAIEIKPVTLTLHKGINVISLPVKAEEGPDSRDPAKRDLRMSDLAEHIGKDNLAMIIRYDYTQDKFISYLPTFPDDSKANATVKANEGYIVVMKADQEVEFEAKSSNDDRAAPLLMPLMLASDNQSHKTKSLVSEAKRFSEAKLLNEVNISIPSLHSRACFVVTGSVRQEETGESLDDVSVMIRNLRTGQTVYDATGTLAGYGNYVATFVQSEEEFMTSTGDTLSITAIDKDNRFVLKSVTHTLTTRDISAYVLVMPLRLSLPKKSALLPNYPNPFNPETWIPFQLATDSPVIVSIYNANGYLIRTISLGNRHAGIYVTKDKAAYWDGTDNLGEKVSSGVYYYTLQAGEFRATQKMVIVK